MGGNDNDDNRCGYFPSHVPVVCETNVQQIVT